MRSRLLLGGLVAGVALSFVPAASAEPVNCHHNPQLCETIEDLQPSINCHHIQWVCDAIGNGA
jgi:hypothetical protein